MVDLSYKSKQRAGYSPLVSVIVPNYNYSRYLRLRMDSILSQTYDNYEIILLDDNSTDDSVEVLKAYESNPKVSRILLNDRNSGSPFIQWEKGIKASLGDIIWIAESDDVCSSSFLESLVVNFEDDDVSLAFCRSILIDSNGNRLRENHQMGGVDSPIKIDGKQFIKQYLCYSNEVQNASCAIFRKSIAKQIDKRYMNFSGAGDWLFWIEISEKGKVCYLNRELNSYRLHNNSTSKVIKTGVEFREMKSIFEWLLDNKYMDYNQYLQCRYNNIRLIGSLKEIPSDVKSRLYNMWEVSFNEKLRFCLSIIKGKIISKICLLKLI
jgi:glycosyltransferase involved in cell wall biosynthesis